MSEQRPDQQSLWDAEDSVSFRKKLRERHQAVGRAEEAEREARSKHALAVRATKEARLLLRQLLEEDCTPMPLFEHAARQQANGEAEWQASHDGLSGLSLHRRLPHDIQVKPGATLLLVQELEGGVRAWSKEGHTFGNWQHTPPVAMLELDPSFEEVEAAVGKDVTAAVQVAGWRLCVDSSRVEIDFAAWPPEDLTAEAPEEEEEEEEEESPAAAEASAIKDLLFSECKGAARDWEGLRELGASDADILIRLKGLGPSRDMKLCRWRGEGRRGVMGLWLGPKSEWLVKPHYEGQAVIDKVREVMDLRRPGQSPEEHRTATQEEVDACRAEVAQRLDLCELHPTPGGKGPWRSAIIAGNFPKEHARVLAQNGITTVGSLADYLASGKDLAALKGCGDGLSFLIVGCLRAWWKDHVERELPAWLAPQETGQKKPRKKKGDTHAPQR